MSGVDPFFAPRSGRGSEDPFKSTEPRRAAPTDPFGGGAAYKRPRTEGKRSPRVSFEIPTDPGGRRKDVQQFQLSEDIRQLYDAFSFSIPNPEGRLNYMLNYAQYPIKIWESDPAVQEGEDILQLRGVIVEVSQDTSREGSILHFTGYDLGWLLTSCAPYWYNLKGKQWSQIASDLLDPSWVDDDHGFRAIIGINLNSRTKLGRIDAEAAKLNSEVAALKRLYAGRQEIVQALFTNIKALTPKIQIQPGETVGDVLTRYARLEQRFVSVSALGDLQFWQPDYKQRPEYVFHWHWDKERARYNNLENVSYRRDGEPIYNDISCVGSTIYPVLLPNQDDPNEGKFAGRFNDYVGRGVTAATSTPQWFRRRLSFADSERYTRARAQVRAQWRFEQGLYDGETWTATVEGHSQNGVPFVAGKRAEIHDTKNGVDKVMFITRVDRMQDVVGTGGTRARITCKPDGLLAA